jgi:hypothetical protein
MHGAEFCVECGRPLLQKWRRPANRNLCKDCRRRNSKLNRGRLFAGIAVVAVIAFGLGRYMRPAPPPLIIQRSANSPLADDPISSTPAPNADRDASAKQDVPASVRTSDESAYICGARTKKGTPCRRRVHFAGERCFQHKGLPAILPLEKLALKP